MKRILIQLTIFLSISSFAQYQYNESGRISLSQFSKGTPVLLVVDMPGGGGGNGPYKNVRNELIRQIEENQEEIVEKAKLLAERMGYDYDSLEVIIAVPAYEKAGQLFTYPHAIQWNKEVSGEKGIKFLPESEDSGTKLFRFNKEPQFLNNEFYPGGGGGNGPYKETVTQWGQREVLTGEEIMAIERGEINIGGKLLQITEKQIEAVEQNGIVNVFSDYNWNDEKGQIDEAIKFSIKINPEISAIGSSVWAGYAHTTEKAEVIKTYGLDNLPFDTTKDPSSIKIIYAEPLGGGGGGGGQHYLIQIK